MTILNPYSLIAGGLMLFVTVRSTSMYDDTDKLGGRS